MARRFTITGFLMAAALVAVVHVSPLSPRTPGLGLRLIATPAPTLSPIGGTLVDAVFSPAGDELLLVTRDHRAPTWSLFRTARGDDGTWSVSRAVGVADTPSGAVAWHPSGDLVHVSEGRLAVIGEQGRIFLDDALTWPSFDRRGWRMAGRLAGDLVVVDLWGWQRTPVTRAGVQSAPALNKSGGKLAWLQDDRALVVLDLDTGDEAVVARGAPGALGPPAFAGHQLAYQYTEGDTTQLRVAPVFSELRTAGVLVHDVVPSARPPDVTRNKKWIAAATRTGDVVLVRNDGGRREVIPTHMAELLSVDVVLDEGLSVVAVGRLSPAGTPRLVMFSLQMGPE